MNSDVHVLVIEPVPILQACVKLGMKKLGCIVDIAADDKIGLEKALTIFYDLIIIEIGEKEKLDGFAITAQIKKQSIINQFTPLIGITVHHEPGCEEIAKAYGITEYVEGPFLIETAEKIFTYVKTRRN